MPDKCKHLDQIKIRQTSKRVRGLPQNRRHLDALKALLNVRPRGVLRFLQHAHATRHFHETKHPLVRSIEPGETWLWCYVDEVLPGELER